MRSQMVKKLFTMTMICALAMGAIGCGGNASESSGTNENAAGEEMVSGETEERVVHIGLSGDPGTLDPFSSYSGPRRFAVLYPVYETLTTKDGTVYENVLAKEWVEVEGTEFPTYDVTIWDNIVDSAGNPMTADDVVWCVNKHLENGVIQETAHVGSIEKIDDYTVRVSMMDYTMGAFQSFMMGTPIITKAAFEASGQDGMATKPVGTGPYVVSEYISGSKILFEENKNYWQPEENMTSSFQRHNVSAYEIIIIKEANQAAIALENGDIDFYSGINTETAARFKDEYPNITTGTVYSGGTVSLFANCSKGSILADNEKLRECLMHAVDIDSFIAGVTNNNGIAAKDLAYPYAIGYVDSFNDEEYFTFDVDYCKELLKEAGYKEGELTLRLMVTTIPDSSEFAQMYQANLEEIGIKLELLSYDNALYEQYKTNAAEWDLLMDIGGLTYMSDYYRKLDAREYTEDTKSACFVDDDKLYELVAIGISENTTSDETIQEMHDYVVDKAYARGLWAYAGIYAYRNDVFSDLQFNSQSSCIAGRSTYSWDK